MVQRHFGKWHFMNFLDTGGGDLIIPYRELVEISTNRVPFSGGSIPISTTKVFRLDMLAMRFPPGYEPDALLMSVAPELLDCIEETIQRECVASGCGAYLEGDCIAPDGTCKFQKMIKVVKKARGE